VTVMNCDEWNEILALGEEAGPERLRAALEHAKQCPECRRVAAGFRAFKEALKDDRDEVDDPEVREKILALGRAQAEEFARERAASRRHPIRLALVVAAILALAAAIFLVMKGTSPGRDPVEVELDAGDAALTRGERERARNAAEHVLSLPGASALQKEHARRLEERAR